MKDLGLGVFDRRTVIVTLFIIVIINVLFQYDLPVRINNAGELFTDLILFTGYLYLARLFFRLPIALLLWILTFSATLKDANSSMAYDDTVQTLSKDKKLTSKITVGLIKLIDIPAQLIVKAFLSAITSELIYKTTDKPRNVIDVLLGFIDRVGLLMIIFVAMLPRYAFVTKMFGILGLLVMVGIYLVMGQFSFSAIYNDELAENKVADKWKDIV